MRNFDPVFYEDGDTRLSGFLARPDGKARAAILVFPTIMNLTASVKDKARELAEAGYIALIADFYGSAPENFDEARTAAAAIRETPDSYRQRLRAALRALISLDDVDDDCAIATIGFCMGGQAALELAREGAPLAAAVSFHGLLNTEQPAEKNAISARILVCHGDADPMVPRSQVVSFWEEMDHAGANWHFHSYGGVKHGFTNPQPNDNPATAYDASADQQSWAAMHALFDEILR
ncbi:dienelactone hydrolase family protein [Altericroceibacterium endophyticum]|uniref:Prolyl oligopeptidase family serine peptidase n=1 Tax=Altericroceibacterium endophyticum TaxID=1808508 RepID=A0A6I4T2J0_9SPHN|nr:dienelactone hydrolase family protein [Altericroceibacterium endophyticum]MXO64441.1 prolyl oligopeptidase family serine peptidase [Altericroceibacterium endophyticum]